MNILTPRSSTSMDTRTNELKQDNELTSRTTIKTFLEKRIKNDRISLCALQQTFRLTSYLQLVRKVVCQSHCLNPFYLQINLCVMFHPKNLFFLICYNLSFFFFFCSFCGCFHNYLVLLILNSSLFQGFHRPIQYHNLATFPNNLPFVCKHESSRVNKWRVECVRSFLVRENVLSRKK